MATSSPDTGREGQLVPLRSGQNPNEARTETRERSRRWRTCTVAKCNTPVACPTYGVPPTGHIERAMKVQYAETALVTACKPQRRSGGHPVRSNRAMSLMTD